jgi:dihydrolipoamide dehydrogenase
MIGAGVTDMIAEAVLGRKLETTGHEVLKAVHPHPTMSEAVMEAVAKRLWKPLPMLMMR